MTDKTEREAIVAWLREEAGDLFEKAGRSSVPQTKENLRQMAHGMVRSAEGIIRGDHLSGKDDV